MPKKQFYEYPGKQIVVRYEPKRCIHAESCVHGLPGVFDRYRRPWIDPDQGSADAVAEVVMRCPTGALHFERPGEEAAEPAFDANTAEVVADGPLYLAGRLRLQLPEGQVLEENRIALCRCGASQNKPFCDNSHQKAGFGDAGELGAAMLAPLAEGGEPEAVELTTAKNGPLLLRGPIEIRGADGESSQRGSKGALCRCGASQNKPYCDGSHKAAGFEAD